MADAIRGEKVCGYCKTEMKSPYVFWFNGHKYLAHKYCCGSLKRQLEALATEGGSPTPRDVDECS